MSTVSISSSQYGCRGRGVANSACATVTTAARTWPKGRRRNDIITVTFGGFGDAEGLDARLGAGGRPGRAT